MAARRSKPKNLVGPHSVQMWEEFDRLCDKENIGIHPMDWQDWWKFFYAGYHWRDLEVRAAMT